MKKFALILAAAAASSLMAADGAAIYKKCVACHGVKAEKPGLGKSEVIAGWPADKIVASLQRYKAGTENKYGLGATMKGQAASLSDEDMKALGEYISTLK